MDQRETSWRLRGGLRRGPSARRFGPSRRPRVAMEVNPAPLLSCTSSPPNPPATTLSFAVAQIRDRDIRAGLSPRRLRLLTSHMPSRGSAAGQQAQRPHQVFPARRATCQQTALKKVGSKREAGQRPPRVRQPHLWSREGVHVDGTEESVRRWSSTGLPPLRAIIAAFVLN